jgi:hypothetical protein
MIQFFRQTQTPDPVAWSFVAFVLLGFGALPAMMTLNAYLRSRRGRTIVSVSSEGIRVQSRGAWKTRTIASVAASEILDVDYSTRESLAGAARRAAEQDVVQRGQSPAPPVVGPRTERVLAVLSRWAQGRGVQIKSRQGLTEFGEGLEDEEIRYLHSVVLRVLAGSPSGGTTR